MFLLKNPVSTGAYFMALECISEPFSLTVFLTSSKDAFLRKAFFNWTVPLSSIANALQIKNAFPIIGLAFNLIFAFIQTTFDQYMVKFFQIRALLPRNNDLNVNLPEQLIRPVCAHRGHFARLCVFHRFRLDIFAFVGIIIRLTDSDKCNAIGHPHISITFPRLLPLSSSLLSSIMSS